VSAAAFFGSLVTRHAIVSASGFEIFEVTADKGIRAWASDLPGLFRAAALGLWSLMVAPEQVAAVEVLPVEVEAPDREMLLAGWLNELLYLHEVQYFAGADLTIRELTETRLRADVRGERLDTTRHQVVGHVKAVTYHGLRIQGGPGGWEARVVVDV
jgi:SHS2 domain-containing protein